MKIAHLVLATSNPGKLREYQRLVPNSSITLELMQGFSSLTPFDEAAPTFAENGAGKALHYSQFSDGIVLAEDSGLVIPALDGAPGVLSARYGGPQATDEDRVHKVVAEMKDKRGDDRVARFVCVTSLAYRGRAIAIVSDSVEGQIADVPAGSGGFGYDPIFFVPKLGCTFAQASAETKDKLSHRGKAFRRLLVVISEINGTQVAFGS